MKKSLLALAALGTFAGVAHAQSSVTLYGIVDAGFVYNNNSAGSKLYETSAGNLQGDRWGLRGTEDLGGGLKALFVLENGFNAYSGKLGQGGDEFGRQAYVGLSSQFGTVTLGRQYDSVVDYTGALEVGSQWASFYAAHPGDLDNMNNSNRVNNSIKYASANYSGITFGGLYSLGGVAGQFNRNQIFSAGLGYAQGPLVGRRLLQRQEPELLVLRQQLDVERNGFEHDRLASVLGLCNGEDAASDLRWRCLHVRPGNCRRNVQQHAVQGSRTDRCPANRLARHGRRQVPQRRTELQVSVDPGVAARRSVRLHEGI
jgi:hypothetical protein